MHNKIKYGALFQKPELAIWFLFILVQPLAAESPADNPLYQALPHIDHTIEGLLEFKPQLDGFIPTPFRESIETTGIPTEENFFLDIGIQLAEKKFDAFCKDRTDPTTHSTIPHIVHLIWLGSKLPSSINLVVRSWKNHHPDWEVRLWTDRDVESFSWSNPHSKSVFDQGKNWGEKTDILRLEILYQYGGIYSDTDIICFKSFEDLTSRGLTLFAGLESNKIKGFGRPLIGCAIIGAAKNSSVIKACIDSVKSEKESPTMPQELRSGPGPLTLACYDALASGSENILILPCSYLYPLPWENRLVTLDGLINYIRPETLAIHLWEGSWFDLYCYRPEHLIFGDKPQNP